MISLTLHSPTWRAWSRSYTVRCVRTSSNSPWFCHVSTASASCVPQRSWWQMATHLRTSPQSPTHRPPHPTPAHPVRHEGLRPKLSRDLWTVCCVQVKMKRPVWCLRELSVSCKWVQIPGVLTQCPSCFQVPIRPRLPCPDPPGMGHGVVRRVHPWWWCSPVCHVVEMWTWERKVSLTVCVISPWNV